MRRLLVGVLPKDKDVQDKYEKVLSCVFARLGEKYNFLE